MDEVEYMIDEKKYMKKGIERKNDVTDGNDKN